MAHLLKNPIFQDENKARTWLEARVWPHGPHCPHCGNADAEKITKLEGKAHRSGLYQCNEPECREQFTVTVGTVFERSKIPLTKWLAALFLMTASKKGVSAHQAHRMLGVSYKSTWFMMHRLREAMRSGGLEPLGGAGKVVEADETYFGKIDAMRIPRDKRPRHQGMKYKNNRPIVALIERGGSVRSFHVAVAQSAEVSEVVLNNIARESTLNTDESRLYHNMSEHFAKHETVKHSDGEYVRDGVSTNDIESVWAVLKRGLHGVYHHASAKHLDRYVDEFTFRLNDGTVKRHTLDRLDSLVRGTNGRRITYKELIA